MTVFPKKLLTGYESFKHGTYVSERENYRNLATEGQKPEVLVIACCDSRAAPETIFNSGPGELFVVRNVANLVPSFTPDGQFEATSAALEYAVQALRVKDIVIMGHGGCGGINAALNPAEEPLSAGDFIGKWMSLLTPLVTQIQSSTALSQVEQQTALERISVQNSVANLRNFPCVNTLEAKGELNLHGAWFDISSGELWVMDHATGDFSKLVA